MTSPNIKTGMYQTPIKARAQTATPEQEVSNFFIWITSVGL